MKISVSAKNPALVSCDMLVCFVRQPEKGKIKVALPEIKTYVAKAEALGDFQGREGEIFLFYPTFGKKRGLATKRLLVIGLGKEMVGREAIRKAGGGLACEALKTKAQKLVAILPEDSAVNACEATECLCEGMILGAYQFSKYKKFDDPEEKPGLIKEVVILTDKTATARQGMKAGKVAAEAACLARNMANEPANHWRPSHFAAYGRELAKKSGLKCFVLGKAELKRQGLNGILGVNQGTTEPPAMVVLEHHCGKRKAPTVLLVGKGLTFDSGGISLKPSAGMEDMKFDMCGGAAVMAVMKAVASEQPKNVNVVAIVPATENLPGPSAMKPGDVITMYGGKTVEVINTDAEGRLILADALAYGVAKFKPAAVLDIATLTGAVIVGLGHHYTGILGNDDKLVEDVIAAGDRSGEPAWRLPLGTEYAKQLKSDIADLKNVDKRDAGTILGAVFLEEFIGETPWVHLDIAGTAWNFTKKTYIPKGPSAVGVRTILEWIRSY